MTRTVQISFSRGATVNTGNFNSGRCDVTATVEVAEGDDPDSAFDRAREWVNNRVAAEVDAIRKEKS